MTVSFSKLQHRSSQSLASLSLENKVATTTTTTYQGSASKEALVAPAAAGKHTIIAASLGESSRAAAMATHVVNGRTTTRSRRARPSSLGGSPDDFASKGLQMDQVMAATSPAEERKLTSKTSSRGTTVVPVVLQRDAHSFGFSVRMSSTDCVEEEESDIAKIFCDCCCVP
jgi:hypothetical protein